MSVLDLRHKLGELEDCPEDVAELFAAVIEQIAEMDNKLTQIMPEFN
jgi:hypothetical protein